MANVSPKPITRKALWRTLLERSIPLLPTAIFGVSILAVNSSGYLFHIIMGRLLTPGDFGLFSALFAPFYLVSLGAGALQTTMAKHVAQLEGSGDPSGAAVFILGALRRGILLSIGLLLLLLALASSGAAFLKAPLPLVLLTIPSILTAVLLPLALGAIQGKLRFIRLSIAYLIGFGLKPILGAVLVLAGLGVGGGILAIALAHFLGLVFALAALRLRQLSRLAGDRRIDFKAMYQYLLPVAVASLCLGVPGTVDLIIVKHSFDETVAGLYTSALILGKIVLFLPAPVSLALLPQVSARNAQGKRTIPLLILALSVTLLSSGLVVALYWGFPSVPAWVFGSAYAQAANIVPMYGLAMLFFALTGIFLYYNLAMGRTSFVLVMAVSTLLEIVWLSVFHASPEQIVTILLTFNAIMATASAFYTLLYHYFRQQKAASGVMAGGSTDGDQGERSRPS